MSDGPLTGVKVVEIAGLGPTPFAAMWLADMGADVIRIERPNLRPLLPMKHDVLNRSRGFVTLDLKTKTDRDQARALIDRADMLIEGMRPGVAERLGVGPEEFSASNPALVYGRMTGWGQTGPLAQTAGHDINYIALTGALHAIGGDAPVPPLNLVGDFGGGAMYLVAGLLAALFAARISGTGQVVDCAITDGTAHLMSMIYGMNNAGIWADKRTANLLDGAAPYYTTYECACGRHMAVGALEPQFYDAFVTLLGLTPGDLPSRELPQNWPSLKQVFAAHFRLKKRDAWDAIFAGTDACVAPVLTLAEAPRHPHNQARGTFTQINGRTQPSAAPRLSKTPGLARDDGADRPQETAMVLARWAAP